MRTLKQISCILLLLFCSIIGYSQAGDLNYFLGKWSFKVFFKGNNTTQPDISAIWDVEKGLDSAACLMGNVVIRDSRFTREIIGINQYQKKWLRTVVTNSGSYILMSSEGWKANRLTWSGTQFSQGKKQELREEITRINEREFKAAFFVSENGVRQQTQTEFLSRISN